MKWMNLVGREMKRSSSRLFADDLVPLRQGDCWWKMGQAGHVGVAMMPGYVRLGSKSFEVLVELSNLQSTAMQLVG